MSNGQVPLRTVNSVAPIRICDIGGWTDTWFSGHGRVLNIAVSPYVEVQARVHPIGTLPSQVVLNAENYGERYGFDPPVLPGRHPLLEATIEEVGVPDDVSVEVSVFSQAPIGCSTGTSASVTVALIGALDVLTPGRLTPHDVTSLAHRIETQRLGIQSGIQDQLCAAYGGINFIEMMSYPDASVTQLTVPDSLWWELERRLELIFLGRAHDSSAVHESVIAGLERNGEGSRLLDELRTAAEHARKALDAADLADFASAMVQNTHSQSGLHQDLVSAQAHAVIEIAALHGAIGWKVNGAGGGGGSVTLLCGPDLHEREALLRALREADSSFQLIPIRLSRLGLRVWEA
jgi:D-glycero-alpha-D-manno-heptose-7-phosphate kinase